MSITPRTTGNFPQREREDKYPDSEEALNRWFSIVTGRVLKTKSEELAKKLGHNDFKATDGWLSRWKHTHGIKFMKTHGDKEDIIFFCHHIYTSFLPCIFYTTISFLYISNCYFTFSPFHLPLKIYEVSHMQSLFKEILLSAFQNISLNTGNVWKDRWDSDSYFSNVTYFSLLPRSGGHRLTCKPYDLKELRLFMYAVTTSYGTSICTQ
jgi:hypothetical protein